MPKYAYQLVFKGIDKVEVLTGSSDEPECVLCRHIGQDEIWYCHKSYLAESIEQAKLKYISQELTSLETYINEMLERIQEINMIEKAYGD